MKRIAFLIVLVAFAAAFAASVSTTRYGNLRMNDQVVTNVDLSGLSMTETDPEFSSFINSGGIIYGPLKFYQPTLGGIDMSVNITSNGVSGWKFNPQGSPGIGIWTSFSLILARRLSTC